MRGGARERSGAPGRRRPSVFFVAGRLKPSDRNGLHVRATRTGPRGSGVLADATAANASLDQPATKKNDFQREQSRNPKERTPYIFWER